VKRLAARATNNRLPVMGEWREMAENGCHMANGPIITDLYCGVAGYVDRILEDPCASQGPGRAAPELQRADLELGAGDREAGEETLLSSDRANLKDQIRVALLLIDQHSERPDVARIVAGLKGSDDSSLRFHAGEIQKNAQAELATLRVELATAWDRLEHGPLP
jgi:hypothetical protein